MRVGTLVKLRSGGPLMTVEAMIGGSECVCIWFEGTTLQRLGIPTAALDIARGSAATAKHPQPVE